MCARLEVVVVSCNRHKCSYGKAVDKILWWPECQVGLLLLMTKVSTFTFCSKGFAGGKGKGCSHKLLALSFPNEEMMYLLTYIGVFGLWLSRLSIQTAGSIRTNDPLAERGGHCT